MCHLRSLAARPANIGHNPTMGRKTNDLYEVELMHGKCIEPKRAMVLARDETDAKRKAESIHRGYHATSVQLVPCK